MPGLQTARQQMDSINELCERFGDGERAVLALYEGRTLVECPVTLGDEEWVKHPDYSCSIIACETTKALNGERMFASYEVARPVGHGWPTELRLHKTAAEAVEQALEVAGWSVRTTWWCVDHE